MPLNELPDGVDRLRNTLAELERPRYRDELHAQQRPLDGDTLDQTASLSLQLSETLALGHCRRLP